MGVTDNGAANKNEFVRYDFVSIDLGYHSEIFEDYQPVLSKKNRNHRGHVLGGGIVTVNTKEKTVKTYGTSGGYGSTSLELLKYVVGEAFKDYEQEVTITRYIRG